MVGCPNHSVLLVNESREYPRPILTPLELWAAIGPAEGVDVGAGGFATTSIQYARRVLGLPTGGASPVVSTALSIAQPLAVSTIARIRQRTYNGLDPEIGETPVQSFVVQGKSGTAKGYAHEE